MRETKKTFLKLFAMLFFAIFGILLSEMQISAANAYYYSSADYEIAYAGIPSDIPITVDSKCNVRITLLSSAKEHITFELLDTTENVLETHVYDGESTEKNFNDGSFQFEDYILPVAKGGNYIFRFRADTYIKYKTTIGPTTATINHSTLSITKGFSDTLKVTNGTVTSWSSSNTSIATIKNGKVSAKKIGKTTITAKLSNGKSLKCKVTVKKNEYNEKKKTIKNTDSGLWGHVYNAYYSKGKLIVKVRIVNNTDSTYNSIGDININVYDKKGKLIGNYYGVAKKGSLKPYKTKDFTFTIKKPKNKKADLRLASAMVEGSLTYR